MPRPIQTPPHQQPPVRPPVRKVCPKLEQFKPGCSFAKLRADVAMEESRHGD